MDQSPTSEAPRTVERRIGGRIRTPDEARLSFAERRPFRRVRRVTADVDVVDLSVTGVAVRVLGGRVLPVGEMVQLSFRDASGPVVVRHVGDATEAGSRVYGLEVPDTSFGLVEALRAAVGSEREDLHWRWNRPG